MLKRTLLETFALVLIAGVPVVLASVPRSNSVNSDTAIYQNLHEIKVNREKSLDFDSDIDRLSAQEKSHRVPLQLSAPMERVMKTKYIPTTKRGNKVSTKRNTTTNTHADIKPSSSIVSPDASVLLSSRMDSHRRSRADKTDL